MDASRWRRIEEVCDAALGLAPAERPAYLDRECGRDADLRREVDALLAHEATAERFLNAPAAASLDAPPIDLIGRRFGEYEITAKLGEGGMGEVYRARDLTLGRDVAIKILPAAFSGDRDRLRRFVREARLLATVNHPSIAGIFGLTEINGGPALVLELVEGETLSATLARGRLTVPRALTLASQIADALDHAHRRGITHRDLKPSNVMVTRSGVKLLDFGVGKWTPTGAEANATRSSTLTAEGAIVGTLHYMAPEQLEGRAADARSDIFSFGAVLFEMLSGRKAFDGPSQASIIAAVMQSPAPTLAGAISAPPNLDRIVARCLDKDPEQRWQSAGDLREAISLLLTDTAAIRPVGTSRRSAKIIAGVAAGIVVAVIGWAAAKRLPSGDPAPPPIRFALQATEGTIGTGVFDVSPDGRQIVYALNPRSGGPPILQTRQFDRFEAVTIPGTEGVHGVAFSPDGEWVAFVAAGVLKKVRVTADSQAITLLDNLPSVFDVAWPTDDAILLVARDQPIRRVPANGGQAQAITTIRNATEVDHHGPELLPSGDLLFAVHGPRNRFSIAAQRANGTEHKTIIESGFDPRLLSNGYLAFGRGSALLAVPFDANSLEVKGDPVIVVERVSAVASSGVIDARLSRAGTLVYQSKPATDARQLIWVDRNGRETPLPLSPRTFLQPSVSPDGTQVAFVAEENDQRDIFTYDLTSGRTARITQGGDNWWPTWTRDSSAIAFGRDAGVASELVLYRPSGGTFETLATSVNDLLPGVITTDGKASIVTQQPPTDQYFMSSLSGKTLTPMRPPEAGRHGFPRLSPDGRWIAYAGRIGGRMEVFVEEYPTTGSRRQITVSGGTAPLWRRDGKELYFKNAGTVFAVPIDTTAGLTWGKVTPLFSDPFPSFSLSYDIGRDGRFLMVKPGPAEGAALPLNVVVNWASELAARLPTTR